MTTTTTTTIVTREELNRAERIIDGEGHAFYMVRSSHYDENYTEYVVKAIKVNGRYFIVCDCPAGQRGINCQHKKIAAAAAQVERTAIKEAAMSRPTMYTNVDAETLARVTRASLANRQAPKSLVEQDARHYNDNRPFCLMK